MLKHGVDRRLNTGYLRVVSLTVLGMSLLMLAVSLWTWDGSFTVFGPALGADFTGCCVADTILNGESPERLYDLELQNELYHRLLPRAPAEESLAYMYPPFFTLLFRPLAAIPLCVVVSGLAGDVSCLVSGQFLADRADCSHARWPRSADGIAAVPLLSTARD